jgi:hypothetical protein
MHMQECKVFGFKFSFNISIEHTWSQPCVINSTRRWAYCSLNVLSGLEAEEKYLSKHKIPKQSCLFLRALHSFFKGFESAVRKRCLRFLLCTSSSVTSTLLSI